ncbi:MAG: response regulator [Phycisphaerae bacterium]|nr:response regulator [Phycisphaerae bacterium]
MICPLSLAGRKLLVVDDCEEITRLLADMFSACGARVSRAKTADEAMRLIQSESFDLLVLDMVMPDVDGWDIHRLISRTSPTLAQRTIFITGDRWNRRTLSRLSAQGLPVVYKPFDLERFRQLACCLLEEQPEDTSEGPH